MAMNGELGAVMRRSRQNSSMSPIPSTAALRASPTVQCGAGWVSGTPGASTSAAILLQSMWRRSETGMPAARAFSTLASVSSHATTSAPPASSALALASPDAPRPKSATLRPANVVMGIMLSPCQVRRWAPLPLVGRGRGWGSNSWVRSARQTLTPLPNPPPQGGREHSELAARLSSQFQRREPGKREHNRDDPESDHDLRLGPALLLEMMMQRRHAEHALAREAERDHLHDHRDRLEHEQSAHDRERELLLGRDRNGAEQAAERERAGIAHEDRCRRRVEPEEAEAGADHGAAQDRKLAGARDEM